MSMITLVSTYSKDSFFDQNGTLLRIEKGGPMLFLKKALDDIEIVYNEFSYVEVNVDILINENGEFGKLPNLKTITLFEDFEEKNTVIVSTILSEWNLEDITLKNSSEFFLDLQGFVRDGKIFGGKKFWQGFDKVVDKISCLKATEDEIDFISAEALQKMKSKILLITKGSKGVDLYFKNQFTHVPAIKVDNCVDTVGAGDTFFGYFVGYLKSGLTPVLSVQKSVKKTSDFLLKKTK